MITLDFNDMELMFMKLIIVFLKEKNVFKCCPIKAKKFIVEIKYRTIEITN